MDVEISPIVLRDGPKVLCARREVEQTRRSVCLLLITKYKTAVSQRGVEHHFMGWDVYRYAGMHAAIDEYSSPDPSDDGFRAEV